MATRARVSHDPLYVPGQGVRALMRAVLVDAIECLTGDVRRSRAPQHAAEARAWVESRNRDWPFSFDNICSALDLDADRMRRRLFASAITLPAPCERPPRVREEEVADMIRAGHPLRVVAAKFGISMPKVSVLSRGLASRLKAERDAHMWSLRRSGWTVTALAIHFHLSLFRIRRICARAERAARERARGAAARRPPPSPANPPSPRCWPPAEGAPHGRSGSLDGREGPVYQGRLRTQTVLQVAALLPLAGCG